MPYTKPRKIGRRILLTSVLLLTAATLVSASLSGNIAAPFNEVLCAISKAARRLSVPLAALIIIAAAALWVESRDDAGKRNAARVWIVHAIIGLIALLIAINVINSIVVAGAYATITVPGACI